MFDYQDFKERILDSGLTPAQLAPLSQRLETLESFMPNFGSNFSKKQKESGKEVLKAADTWSSKVGHHVRLIIISDAQSLVNLQSSISLVLVLLLKAHVRFSTFAWGCSSSKV